MTIFKKNTILYIEELDYGYKTTAYQKNKKLLFSKLCSVISFIRYRFNMVIYKRIIKDRMKKFPENKRKTLKCLMGGDEDNDKKNI